MVRRFPWVVLAAFVAACGSTATPDSESAPNAVRSVDAPLPTIAGVGSLPDTIPVDREPLTVIVTRPVDDEGVVVESVGVQAAGNRLLIIGDSIMAGTARRYGNEMCDGLGALGWSVAVEAEAGRFVDFGVDVVDELVPQVPVVDDPPASDTGTSDAADEPDWDVAAVHLGSNYGGDRVAFEDDMRTILDRLAPRPTLLYTVTEYRSNWAEVNEVVELLADEYDNVTLLDWGAVARTPGVLRADGLHPGDEGEAVLVELTGAALGTAPDGEVECIRSQFSDDSAIGEGNGSPNTGGSSSGSSSGGSRGSSSGGSSSSGSSSSSSGGSGSSGSSTSGSSSSSSSGGSSSGGSSSTSTDGSSGDSDSDGTATDGTTDDSSSDGSLGDGSTTDGVDGGDGGTDGGDGTGTDGDGGVDSDGGTGTGTDGATDSTGETDGGDTGDGSVDGSSGGTTGESTGDPGSETTGGSATDGASGSDPTSTGSDGGDDSGGDDGGSPTTGGDSSSDGSSSSGSSDGSGGSGSGGSDSSGSDSGGSDSTDGSDSAAATTTDGTDGGG